MGKFQDRVAIVTGASRGIGRAIAKALAAEGAKVALVYRGSKEAADSAVQEIAQAAGTARAFQVDVSDAAAAERCVEQVLADWGRLDVLVNNAGIVRDT